MERPILQDFINSGLDIFDYTKEMIKYTNYKEEEIRMAKAILTAVNRFEGNQDLNELLRKHMCEYDIQLILNEE